MFSLLTTNIDETTRSLENVSERAFQQKRLHGVNMELKMLPRSSHVILPVYDMLRLRRPI